MAVTTAAKIDAVNKPGKETVHVSSQGKAVIQSMPVTVL